MPVKSVNTCMVYLLHKYHKINTSVYLFFIFSFVFNIPLCNDMSHFIQPISVMHAFVLRWFSNPITPWFSCAHFSCVLTSPWHRLTSVKCIDPYFLCNYSAPLRHSSFFFFSPSLVNVARGKVAQRHDTRPQSHFILLKFRQQSAKDISLFLLEFTCPRNAPKNRGGQPSRGPEVSLHSCSLGTKYFEKKCSYPYVNSYPLLHSLGIVLGYFNNSQLQLQQL